MKVLRVILIVILILFAIYCLVMLALPKNYDISRSVVVKTRPSVAYSYVSDFKNWPDWMVWFEDDATMEVAYGDTTKGVGAHYSWTSENSGSGEQAIVAAQQNKSLSTSIHFKGMFDSYSNGYWHFKPTSDGNTSIIWGFKGDLPFLLRSMSFVLESRIGSAFERGLANIKEHLEGDAVEVMTIGETEVNSLSYYGLRQKMRISEMDSLDFGENYAQIARYLGSDMQNIAGDPRAIFHSWNVKADSALMEFALPVRSEKAGNDTIIRGTTYGGLSLKMVFQGPYQNTGRAHDSILQYINRNNYTLTGAPWEVYITDPTVVKNPQNYLTEVYYPVGKL